MLSIARQNEPLTNASGNDQIISLWLVQKSEATQRTYTVAIQQFLSFHEGKDIRQIKADELLAWVDSLRALSINTQRGKIAVIKSLFGFAHRLGYLSVNPALILTTPKEQQTLTERVLPKSKVRAMVQGADNLRDKLIIKTFYLLGLRVSELAQLQWSDVIPGDEGTKIRIHGKGGKLRYLNLPGYLFDELRELKSDSPYIFNSRKSANGGRLDRSQIYRIIKKLGDGAGLQAMPHGLRHSHASDAIRAGADIKLVSESLGHSSIAVTSKYLHTNKNESSSDFLDI